jgi:hypothetical protein
MFVFIDGKFEILQQTHAKEIFVLINYTPALKSFSEARLFGCLSAR